MQNDQQKLEWIEPEAHELDARETALNSGMGADGQPNSSFVDCTLS